MTLAAVNFIVVIALTIAVIVFVKPEKATGDAIQRLRGLGVAGLRAPDRVPQLTTIITGVSEETIFRMHATPWF